MAKSKKATEIVGGARLHAEVQKTFEKAGMAEVQSQIRNLLDIAKRGYSSTVVTYASTSAPVFACLHKGQPVTEEEFIRLTLEALKPGPGKTTLPIEQDLLLVDLVELRQIRPDLFDSEGRYKFEATGWQSGVVTKINKQLTGTVDLYQKTRNEAQEANKLMVLPTRTSSDNLEMWRAAAVEFIETNNLYASAKGAGTPLWLEIQDEGLLLKSKISYDEYNKQLRFRQNNKPGTPEFTLEPPITRSDKPIDVNAILTPEVHMGHTDADNTQKLRIDKQIIEEALEIAKKSGNQEIIEVYSKILVFLNALIKKQEAIDKIFISYEALANSKANLAAKLDGILELTASLGSDEVILVSEIEGNIQTKVGKVSVSLSARVFNPEPGPTNSWKGRKQQDLLFLWDKFLKDAINSEELMQRVISAPNSSSYLTVFLFKNLARVFDDKELLKVIKNPKRKNSTKRIKFKARKKTLDNKSTLGILKSGEERIKKARAKLNRPSARNKNNLLKGTKTIKGNRNQIYSRNTVALLNADLKSYVIREMVYPALQNRTGRFAASVKVTEVLDSRVIRYIYRKSPYNVFSMSEGKAPWATPQRDPASIIDRAIRKSAEAKLGILFKTEQV